MPMEIFFSRRYIRQNLYVDYYIANVSVFVCVYYYVYSRYDCVRYVCFRLDALHNYTNVCQYQSSIRSEVYSHIEMGRKKNFKRNIIQKFTLL